MNNLGDLAISAALLPAGTITETTTGSAVDLQAYGGEAAVILSAAASGVGSCAVKLQHSDTSNGVFADIDGATFTAVTTSASHQKLSVDTDEIKRFVKAVATLTGEGATQTISVSIVGLPEYR